MAVAAKAVVLPAAAMVRAKEGAEKVECQHRGCRCHCHLNRCRCRQGCPGRGLRRRVAARGGSALQDCFGRRVAARPSAQRGTWAQMAVLLAGRVSPETTAVEVTATAVEATAAPVKPPLSPVLPVEPVAAEVAAAMAGETATAVVTRAEAGVASGVGAAMAAAPTAALGKSHHPAALSAWGATKATALRYPAGAERVATAAPETAAVAAMG